jgi:hypothetical protein
MFRAGRAPAAGGRVGSRKPTAPANRLGRENLPSGKRVFCSGRWRRDRTCRQTLSAAFSKAYEPHKMRWMLPGESWACCGGLHWCTVGGLARCLQSGLRSGPRAGRQHQPRDPHRRRRAWLRMARKGFGTTRSSSLVCADTAVSFSRAMSRTLISSSNSFLTIGHYSTVSHGAIATKAKGRSQGAAPNPS